MKVIDEILEREGWPEYTNDPNDSGGPSKGGITRATLQEWRRFQTGDADLMVTAADVEALRENEARLIYLDKYVEGPGFSGIDDDLLREQVTDAGVLQGVGWSTRRLQELVGVKVDGKCGPITQRAANDKDAEALNDCFTAWRTRKLARIVYNDCMNRGYTEGQIKWLNGWINRATEFLIVPL